MTVIARVPRGNFAYWEKRFAPYPRLTDAVLPVHYLDCPDSGRILGFVRQPSQTLMIDLRQTPDAIIGCFRANTRNEIRRAEREAVQCRAASGFDQFLALYEAMSTQKTLPPTPRGYLESLGKHRRVTEAIIDDKVVCSHVYVADRSVGRVRLIRSASLFRESEHEERQLIARANRLLHFRDILLFREQGFDLYDLGGYYPATAPLHPELTRINEFKASFGGQLRHEANYLSAALHAYRVTHDLYRRARGI
jgi:lipid II:glycine glycyltransferase (peptidoglycan interpeptide bridge formation enzyme)